MLRWLALLIALTLTCLPVWASDVVTLRDGQRITGVVERIIEGSVWVRPGGGQQVDFFPAAQVESVELGDENPLKKRMDLPPPAPGLPKAVVITLGQEQDGFVGIHVTAEMMKEVIQRLKAELGEDHQSVVILRVKCGGGYWEDVVALADTIHKELKPRWRMVCWVDAAMGNAAGFVSSVSDVVFTPTGLYAKGYKGGMFGRSPTPPTEEQLLECDRLSGLGGRDPLLLRSLLLDLPLSANPSAGDVGGFRFFSDTTSGSLLINQTHEYLWLKPETALKIGLSKGTADTLRELTKVLGYEVLDWVGDRAAATYEQPWPVCAAEAWNIAQRADIGATEQQLSHALSACHAAIRTAAATPQGEIRDSVVSAAEARLKTLKELMAKHPLLPVSGCRAEERDEVIKGLAESIARLRAR